jgi:hypothetical protein
VHIFKSATCTFSIFIRMNEALFSFYFTIAPLTFTTTGCHESARHAVRSRACWFVCKLDSQCAIMQLSHQNLRNLLTNQDLPPTMGSCPRPQWRNVDLIYQIFQHIFRSFNPAFQIYKHSSNGISYTHLVRFYPPVLLTAD